MILFFHFLFGVILSFFFFLFYFSFLRKIRYYDPNGSIFFLGRRTLNKLKVQEDITNYLIIRGSKCIFTKMGMYHNLGLNHFLTNMSFFLRLYIYIY
jgi:hypothetical protein